MKHKPRLPDPYGIVAVHASAVRTGAGALVFLGPSGAGKSTIVGLLADKAELFAEDQVYLVPRSGGSLGVADTRDRTFFGPLKEEEVRALETEPLIGLFRLHKAEKTRLERLDQLELCHNLVEGFLEVFWHLNLEVGSMKEVFHRIARISREALGYNLYFNKTSAVGDVLSGKYGF